ncbi:MAG: phosphoribosylanthranilate isomerase [Planctomycetaceae bacterium]|nr:phosphoribosylanthranilate isomerase [Planctomycetaceae bacterium]
MFQVKICGITSVNDAQAAADAGADAIGLNFYPDSPRYVEPETAFEICQQLPQLLKVAVFVNEPSATIQQHAQQIGFDAVQLHGDETPGQVAELADLRLIRAFRCRDSSLETVEDYWHVCQQQESLPQALLLDAYHPEQYGGTGKCLAWNQLHPRPPLMRGSSWILAGGLTPTNVAEAIRSARPDGVDTAGGVESEPGQKDHALIQQFVTAARTAFASLS